jgi:hypothetical protein
MYSPALVTWRSQYDRMERGYIRLNEPYQSSTNYEDDIQQYFQDCWHLKDWIKNDVILNQSVRNNIETEVDNHESLRIVADLANGSKHLNITRNIREGAHVTGGHLTIGLGQNKPIDIDYVVTLNKSGKVLSAKSVVKEAFDSWQIVLKKFKLM